MTKDVKCLLHTFYIELHVEMTEFEYTGLNQGLTFSVKH